MVYLQIPRNAIFVKIRRLIMFIMFKAGIEIITAL